MYINLLFLLLVSGSIVAQDKMYNSGNIHFFSNSNFCVFGDLQNNGTIESTSGTVYFKGTSEQNFSGTQNVQFYNVQLNNTSSGGIIFSTNNMDISNLLTLTDGKVQTSSAGLIHMLDNSIVASASNDSYIEGPMQKTGNDAFVFPIGKNGNYQPLSISAPGSTIDKYTSEYFEGNPRTVFGNTLDPSIDHISACEYWQLNRDNGNSTVQINVGWNTSSCGITAPTDLIVAHWDSTIWENFGSSNIMGNNSLGTLSTNTMSSKFGFFTIGSITPENPLPVELVYFDALKKETEREVELIWQTNSERDNDYFTIERSENGISFELLEVVDGAGTSNSILNYGILDKQPYSNITYYRLKQTDFNGLYSFSEIKSVELSRSSEFDVYPNPNKGKFLTLKNINFIEETDIAITDIAGRTIYRNHFSASNSINGQTKIEFENVLSPGDYLISIINPVGISSKRFTVY